MNKFTRILSLIVLVALLVIFPTTVNANSLPSGSNTSDLSGGIVFGQNYTVESGQTVTGGLVVVAGNLEIKAGGTVNGDVAVMFGNLTHAGTVTDNVVIAGSQATFEAGSSIGGKLLTFAGTLTSSDKVQVQNGIQQFNSPNDFTKPTNEITFFESNPLLDALFAFLRSVGMALLGLVAVLLGQKYVQNAAMTARTQPWLSGGMGLMALLATPVIFLILIITILLIPAAFLFGLLLFFAIMLGWIAVGYDLGQRLEKALKVNLADAVSTAIGIFILGIITWLLGYICCIGWLVSLAITSLGLGSIILSRFGTRVYTPSNPTQITTLAHAEQVHTAQELADIPPSPESVDGGTDSTRLE